MAALPPGRPHLSNAYYDIPRVRRRPRRRARWQAFGDLFAAWAASSRAFWWTIGLTAGVLIATVAAWVAR